MSKRSIRLRRANRARSKMKELMVTRLSVNRTPRHIYAQLIAPDGKILGSASTLSTEVKSKIVYGGNIAAARVVGDLIAVQGKRLGISKVAFDRSGFGYHGRIKALAEAARASGLDF